MKVIDLLNKIANGEEVPIHIRYDGIDLYYNKKNNCYDLIMSNVIEEFYTFSYSDLNNKVEILEEPKGIPEKICTNRIINTKDILEFEMIQNKINAEYTYAINWILDYLESKGDE